MNFTIRPENPKGTVILVVVLAVVLVWIAGMEGSARSRKAAAATPAAAIPATSPAAAATPARAVPGTAGDIGLAAMIGTLRPPAETVDTTFGANPFLSVDEILVDEPEEAIDTEPEADLRLSGTVVDAGRSLALISGRYVTPGQEIQGWRLAWVAPREARLERGGRTLTLRMDSE